MLGFRNLVQRALTTPFTGVIGNSFSAKVTQQAPWFKGTAVIKNEFKEISLDDYKDKYLVLFFYPLDFTFVCPTELTAFSDHMSEFNAIDTNVIGVSVDSHFSHHAWINTPRNKGGLGGLKYPLLSDMNRKISLDYDVLLKEPGIALRGLFIIDPKGIVRHSSVNDLPVGRSVKEILRLVKAFKFTDKHGEVCPADWESGSNTIKPTVDDSKEYFSSVK